MPLFCRPFTSKDDVKCTHTHEIKIKKKKKRCESFIEMPPL